MKRTLNRPLPVPSTRAIYTVWTIVAALIIGGGIWLTVFVLDSRQVSQADRADLRSRLTETRVELDATRGDLDGQEAASTALAEQVESLGEEPVVNPASPPRTSTGIPIPGVRGPGPTFGTVLRAVGQNINAALLEVCDGSCDGADGSDGTDGTDGAPGESIAGADGRNGTDGKDGAKGDTGDKGDPGRGIVTGPTCNEDGTWTTTFTDGTTETQDGPCRVGLLPVPDPEPTE